MNLLIIAGVIGPQQIILILVIVLIFFGGKKIPELMKGLGRGIRDFKKASQGDDQDEDNNSDREKLQR